jgi:hypothetical protein
VWEILVKRDPQAQFDLPAFDPDVFEDEAEELLALLEVRGVQSG